MKEVSILQYCEYQNVSGGKSLVTKNKNKKTPEKTMTSKTEQVSQNMIK